MLKNLTHQTRNWVNGNPYSYLKIIVTAGVMISSLAIPFMATRFSLRYLNYLIALLPGIAVVTFVFRQPALGLVLSLLGGIFIPFTGPSGISVVVLGLLFMLGVWILEMMVHDKKIALTSSRVIRPAFAFILVAIITFVLGQFPWYPLAQKAPLDAQVGGFFIYFLSASALLLAAHLIRSEIWLKRLVWIFILVGGVYIITRFLHIDILTRLFHNGFISQSMFWTWLVALTLGQGLYNEKLQPRQKIVLLALVLLTFYVAYFQAGSWKSGYLPALVAAGVIIMLRYPKFILGLTPLWIFGAWYLSSQAIASDQYSYGTRIEAWKIVLELARANPFFGLGFGNYYFYTPLIPILGWYVSFNSHSQYVDIIAQSGLVGLACFLWIFWEVGKSGWNLRTKVDQGFSRGFVYGVLGGIAGTLAAGVLVDWVLPFVYNIGFNGFRASILPWMFMGGLIGLEQMTKKTKDAE